MLRTFSFLSFCVLSFFSAAVHAAPMDDLVKLLSFNQFQASFTQTTRDQKNTELQKLEGELQLQKPDRFFWQSYDPFAQKLISNGKVIWHYDADLEQVVVQEYAKQAEKAPMMLVFRDSDALAQTFILVSDTMRKKLRFFVLETLDAQSALRTVELGFSGQQLVQLRFVDNLQQTTDVLFRDVKVNEPATADKFEFSIPEGADVLYE